MAIHFNFGILMTTLSLIFVAHVNTLAGSWMVQSFWTGQVSSFFPVKNSFFSRRSNDRPQSEPIINQQPPRSGLRSIFSINNGNPSVPNGRDSLNPPLLITKDFYSPPLSPTNTNPGLPPIKLTKPFATSNGSNPPLCTNRTFNVRWASQNSFNNEQNSANSPEVITPSLNQPSLPEWQKIISQNGEKCIATMPKETNIKHTNYEKPDWFRGGDVDYVRSQVLGRINYHRSHHGCGPLTQNNYMTNHAQQWANTLARRNQLIERTKDDDGIYGQTIGESSTMEKIEIQIVDAWYHELRFLKGGDTENDLNDNPRSIGNVIQLLWKKSENIGIGVAKNAYKKYFIVAEYHPKRGNYPFLSDYFPKIEKHDIEGVKNAHGATGNPIKILPFYDSLLTEQVPNSNRANEYDYDSKEHTDDNLMRQSSWKPNYSSASRNVPSSNAENYTEDSPTVTSDWRSSSTTPSKQLSSSNSVKYTEDRPTVTSDWRSNSTSPSKQLSSSNSVNYTDNSPIVVSKDRTNYMKPEQEPIPYDDFEPLRLTREEVEVIRDDVLKKTNHYREMYNLPKLTIHKQLDHWAQEWANELARTNTFKHRPKVGLNVNGRYGENINKSGKFLHLGEFAVDMWYCEIALIDADDDLSLFNNQKIGHATALLWRKSRQMGVGAAINGNGFAIVVANYNPKGNIRHFYKENVPTFTIEQKTKARKIEESIDEALVLPVNVGSNNILRTVPGWQSTIHPNTPMSSASQNKPLKPGDTKMFRYEGRHTLSTMPEDTEIIPHDYVSPLGLSYNEVNSIRSEVFSRANIYRKRHGCTPLLLDENINNHAQEWANHLTSSNIYRERSRDNGGIYGQTLYQYPPHPNLGMMAVDYWYKEMRYLKGEDTEEDLFSNPNDIGNYVQLLWTRSRHMGVGVSKNDSNIYIIVAEYNPRKHIYPFLADNLPKISKQEVEKVKRGILN